MDADPAVARSFEVRARTLGELRNALDRVDLCRELGQDRGLVARARADVENALASGQRERLADPRDHVRLGDRLASADRQRSVVVGAIAQLLGHEELTRDSLHRREHALVDNVPGAQLRVNHPAPALGGGIRRHA